MTYVKLDFVVHALFIYQKMKSLDSCLASSPVLPFKPLSFIHKEKALDLQLVLSFVLL